jgi:hypothetical protein
MRAREQLAADMSPDFDLPVSSAETLCASSVPDWRLAIDFGTTNTSIAVAVGTEISEIPDDVLQSIGGFPGDRALDQKDTQVPTEIAYLSAENDKSVPLDAKRSVLYGYMVKRTWDLPEGDIDKAGFHQEHRVNKMKLLLDPSTYTTDLRGALQRTLSELKERSLIQKHEDVITDLLKCFLQHTKHVLERDYGLLKRDTGMYNSPEHCLFNPLTSSVELTFTVPVCWSAKANSVMSNCLQQAMRQTHFGVDEQSICNIFMVNEAEAAATYAISSLKHRLRVSQYPVG